MTRGAGGGRGGHGRGWSGGGRPQEPRNVRISKSMTYLLRHQAESQGIDMDEGGWVNVSDLMGWRRLADMDPKLTFAELQTIVANDSKQRFTMKPLPSPPPSPSGRATNPNDPSRFLIRAAQGHSLTSVRTDALLQPILPTDTDCPLIAVHGTYTSKWPEILKSGGLKRMGRNQIHFARREPPPLQPLIRGDDRANRVPRENEIDVSGMRRDCNVVIWVDVLGSMEQGGIRWWRGDNGVILTEGGPGQDDTLPMKWVVCAERRGGSERLYGDQDRLKELKELQEKRGKAVQDGAGINLARVNGLAKTDVENVKKEIVKENWDDEA